MANGANWYVVQTYSGYENTVKATLDKTIENRHLEDTIEQVVIPMENVTEMTDNGPKVYERKLLPGYVLVKMVMTDESWYIVRNIRGVSRFPGPVGEDRKPFPLTEEEIRRFELEKHEIIVDYAVGDEVRITDGPLTSFSGIVDMLDVEKNKVRVIVSMFGRETPAELELDQVERIDV